MADLEFVDPATGLVLGAHAFGTVPAGTASASWAARLRYKYGFSGSGLNQNALVLEVSEDGGTTWRTDLAEFTIQVTAVVNTPDDPRFAGTTTSARRTNRLELPPLWAGCAYDLAIVFSPTLHTGAVTSTYSWRLGVAYNESWQGIGLVPDAPTGVLSGIGDVTVTECILAPGLANGTNLVTLGDLSYVLLGSPHLVAGGNVALNQNDSASAALSAGEEYVAVLAADDSASITVTKGVKALAGAALTPACPAGVLPVAVVRVPYGGVIVASTLLAVSGRLVVDDGGGLTVTIQPGRATMPGYYLTPRNVQTVTLPNNATTTVYLSSAGAPDLVEGVPLAEVTTSGGAVTLVTDLRVLLYRGQVPTLISDVDADYHTVSNVVLDGFHGTMDSGVDAGGFGITNLNRSDTKNHAATVEVVLGRAMKRPNKACATTDVVWPDLATNGDFASDISDWSGANWAWDGVGAALHTAGAVAALSQSFAVVSGVTYRVSVTVTGAAGTVTPSIGAVSGTAISAGAGAVVQRIVAGATGTLALAFTPTTDFDGALDDIVCESMFYGLVDIDSVSMTAGKRALLTAQTVTTENGTWYESATAWTRPFDGDDTYAMYNGCMVYVTDGTTNGRALWVQTADIATYSSDAQTWEMLVQFP